MPNFLPNLFDEYLFLTQKTFLLTVHISNKIPHESLFKRRNEIITKKIKRMGNYVIFCL